jgi:hypothetical protein
MGLESTSVCPAVTRMIASVAALVSFQESSELLNELAGVSVDAKQVERSAEALGAEIAEDERRNLEPSARATGKWAWRAPRCVRRGGPRSER